MNLYLYLCPSSAHPPGVLKGLIFGALRRYWRQNSDINDYKHMVNKLFNHLQDRGHISNEITPIFHEAAERLEPGPNKISRLESAPDPTGGTLFFHAQYHPSDISRATIWQAFNQCCPTLQSEIGIAQFTIAYSRQPNLRDKLSKTKLNEPHGQRASDTLSTLLPPVPEPLTHNT